MRKLLVVGVFLVIPLSALAQQTPEVEVFGGYSNLAANLGTSSFDMNGVNFSAAENLNSWFGGALDFTSHFGTENGFRVDTQSLTYGPVFSYRKLKRVVPFSHALVGAVRGGPDYLGISKPIVHFDTCVGGGVDVKIRPNLALRLFQADYVMTRFSKTRQDNMRLSAGIVLLLGKKKK